MNKEIIGRPADNTRDQSTETGGTFYDQYCERCGELHYSSLPHCATCHRELWTFDNNYTPHNGFGNSTNLFD